MNPRVKDLKIYEQLSELFENAKTFKINDDDKIVIFSDLHIGNKGRNDDFSKNSKLFTYALKKYYLKKNFKIVLNGDIEELQRFRYSKIKKKWDELFKLFSEIEKKGKLYKITGNHDYDLFLDKTLKIHEAIKFNYKDNTIFIFHGHQASFYFNRFNNIIGFILRYLANPLGIKNYSFSHDNKRRMMLEQKIYDFSRTNKIISIIGHTHRPLFESLSKIDILKYRIERLCRNYVKADEKGKKDIENNISEYKQELNNLSVKEVKKGLKNSLYASNIVLPCLFNSGCCIGKRGITSIEINMGNIALVHWFDKKVSKKYLRYHKHQTIRMDDSDYFKLILNTDHLDYIFTRIKLLG